MDVLTFVLIALTTHRLTRLIIEDKVKVIAVPRLRVQVWAEARWEKRTGKSNPSRWESGLAYLLSCYWCLSIYVATAVTLGADLATSVPLPALVVFAASTITGLLGTIGGDDDDDE